MPPASPPSTWAASFAWPCWGGLDLASTTDLTAFALLFGVLFGLFYLPSLYWSLLTLGVIAIGVGGLEAESVMLGRASWMRLPEIIGVELTGRLQPGIAALGVSYDFARDESRAPLMRADQAAVSSRTAGSQRAARRGSMEGMTSS